MAQHARQKIALLEGQFKDLCYGFNHLLEELKVVTQGEENCRMKWLEAEDEVKCLKRQLDDLNQKNLKLESQCQQSNVQLKNEIKARTKIQEEKKALEVKLKAARDIVVSAEQDNDEIRAKLELPTPTSTRRAKSRSFPYGCDWLKSAQESSSTAGSSLASVDLLRDRAEEERELSTVRSSRAASRSTKRTSEEVFITTEDSSKHRSRHENSMEMSSSKRLIATTTVTIPKGGPITTTSTIESHPESSDQELETPSRSRKVRIDPNRLSAGDFPIAPSAPPQSIVSPIKSLVNKPSFFGRRSASVPPAARLSDRNGQLRSTVSGSRINQRRHQFSQKTIIKSENCLPCGNRIKFGKPALKCVECRETCHVDCKPLMPTPCIPTKLSMPSGKDFAGTVADYAPSTSPMIPGLVVHCINEIERRGMNEVGLYRLNGSEKEIQDMKDRLLLGRTQLKHLSVLDIHVVTGTLKLFLRSLKEPLITFTLWHSFVRLAHLEDESDIETLVYSLVPELPQPNRDTLAFIILHLQRVGSKRECKMPTPSLARIFGPILIGNSCPDPDPELALRESKKQQFVMEKLLLIPGDYWSRFVPDHW